MRIIFARHGKDDERYRGGWSDLELLPSGVLQAQKMAEKLYMESKDMESAIRPGNYELILEKSII